MWDSYTQDKTITKNIYIKQEHTRRKAWAVKL